MPRNHLQDKTHERSLMKTSRWQALSFSQVALIVLLLLGVGMTFWMENTRSNAELSSERLLRDVERLRFHFLRIGDGLRGIMLVPTNETDRRNCEAALKEAGETLDSMTKLYSDVELRAALRDATKFVRSDLDAHVKKFLGAPAADSRTVAEFLAASPPMRSRRESVLAELALQSQQFIDRQSQHAELVSHIALPAVFVLLIACFFVGRAQAAAVSRPLGELVGSLERMRSGDFSKRVLWKRADEFGLLGEGMNRLAGDLSGLVAQVQRSGIMVNTSATEIAASAKEQQSTATEIAATTAEIGATSKEISATSKELVKTMSEVAKVSEDTAQLANTGQAAINRMEANMRAIIEASGAISTKLATLNERTANINSVVTTITKVADQTNLLSLNAAIEAEKAGEYGLGFAVVAMEIRRLADQTAVATYDIEKMVKEMQSAVAAGVMGMDKFSDEVRRGVEEVRQVSTQLAQIIQQVQTLSPRFHIVNDGMHAQATGAQQISETLVQLSESAHQTAESLRLSNLAIEQLNEAARGLQTSVAKFRLEGA
jgi:methyl-accepting chemotaxis protein WspA